MGYISLVIPGFLHFSLTLKHEHFNSVAASKVKCHLSHYHNFSCVCALYEFRC